jgi:hypothetical protein
MHRIVIDLSSGETTTEQIPQSEIDAAQTAEVARLAALTYAEKRASEYPSFADQFDLLYHGGYEAWRAAIQTIKDKYPK